MIKFVSALRHDIAEILLKVALSNNPNSNSHKNKATEVKASDCYLAPREHLYNNIIARISNFFQKMMMATSYQTNTLRT
jgi:hypothetical protein